MIRPAPAARLASVAIAALALSLAPPAGAIELGDGDPPITLEVIESLFADWHFDLEDPQIANDDDQQHVIDLRNRLTVRLRVSDFTFGLRLDAAWFPSPPSAQYDNDIRPEEMFVTARLGKVTLTLGDDFVTFGRGMALALRKFDDIGFSTSLRGAHVSWRAGRFKTRLVAGMTNTVNVDLVEEKLVPDPSDLVFGARFEGTPVNGFRFGAHAVDIERRHSGVREAVVGALTGDDSTRPINGTEFVRTTLLGGNVELPSIGGVLSLYAEFDYLLGTERRQSAGGTLDNDTTGHATYASATLHLDRWTVLLEGKNYKDYDVSSTLHPDTAQAQGVTRTFPYITPPTLERLDQRIVNNTDTAGAHLRADYQLGRGRDNVFISGAFFADAPADNEFTVHTYAGYERFDAGGDRLLVQAGYRHEDAPDEDILRLRMFHLDVDWFVAFGESLDLQLHLNHEFRSKNIGAPSLEDNYLEGTTYLTVNLPPHWSFTAQFEYLTDKDTDDPLFPGGFVQYRFSQQNFVRLFVGRSKGGLKCSGGVCRVFPDFTGVKLESTFQF